MNNEITPIQNIRTMERQTKKGVGTYYNVTDLLRSAGVKNAKAVSKYLESDKAKRDIFYFESEYNLDYESFYNMFLVSRNGDTGTGRSSIRSFLSKNESASMFSIIGGKDQGTYLHEIVYVWFREWASKEFDLEFKEASLDALKEKAGRENEHNTESKRIERRKSATGALEMNDHIKYRREVIDGDEINRFDFINRYNKQNDIAFGKEKHNELKAIKKERKLDTIRDLATENELRVLNLVQCVHTAKIIDSSVSESEIEAELKTVANNARKVIEYAEKCKQEREAKKLLKIKAKQNELGANQSSLF